MRGTEQYRRVKFIVLILLTFWKLSIIYSFFYDDLSNY